MLEEQNMEKKNTGRATPAPGKSLATDSKAKQDVVPSTKFPRVGRRRDGPVPKNDTASKSWSQKQRFPVRRTQPRGDFGTDNDRYRSEMTPVEGAEIGSAARPGSKKLSLTHLLNFDYGHRDGSRLSSGSWRNGGSSYKDRSHSIWTTRKHKYNKEQFLQANCQFVVQEGRDYMLQSVDPDLLVDWEWIEQVNVYNREMPSCPICLYAPVAAKMTRCGHIYCWPCILHYLALSDKNWRKCPICYEAVHKPDLKSVVALETPCFNVGEEITMQLMCRERGSVMILPKISWKETNGSPLLLSDNTHSRFAKLLLATKEDVLLVVVNREQTELEAALEADKHCPEACFIEAAIQHLQERKREIKEKIGNGACKLTETLVDADVLESKYPSESSCNIDQVGAECLKEDRIINNDILVTGEDVEVKNNSDARDVTCGKGSSKDPFHFYQASDGQHIYMHSVNVHMLVAQYGSLDKCPDTVMGRIVEKEGISMNEDLRRRLRYLGHLPLTCEFELVELELQVPTVSQETLDAFEEEIAKRRKRRTRRARAEHKRERHLQAEENRLLGIAAAEPRTKICLDSLRQFPECGIGSGDEQVIGSEEVVIPSSVGSTTSTISDFMGSPDDLRGAGPSFAQMLREGKAKPDMPHPKVVNSECNPRKVYKGSDSDTEEEEMMHAPAYKDSFSAALHAAFDRIVPAPADDLAESAEGRRSQKKKKGKQKRLLFTTNVIRSK